MQCTVLVSNGAQDELRKSIVQILGGKKNFWRVRIFTQNFSNAKLNGRLTLKEIIKSLKSLGAIVTVVVGSKPRENDIEFYEELLDEGVQIYYNDKVHAKLILAEAKDGKNVALVMSANLTNTGLRYKYEVGVHLSYLEDKVYKKLRAYTSQIIGAPIKTKPIEWVM